MYLSLSFSLLLGNGDDSPYGLYHRISFKWCQSELMSDILDVDVIDDAPWQALLRLQSPPSNEPLNCAHESYHFQQTPN